VNLAFPPEPWDEGLQNERTTLAWTRTALSLAASGVVTVRSLGLNAAGGLAFAALSLALGAAVATGRDRHHERNRQLHAGEPPTAAREVATAASLTVLLSVCNLAIALT